jgi:SAM-dependent MidA family methyltransferase
MGSAAEQVIRERISASGALTFADFMAVALHDPAVGYYARTATPFGARGDYFTSPELHPAFAALIARQLEQLWEALGRPEPFVVHEAGPGSGIFARDLLDWARLVRPDLYAAIEYRLDETSESLRAQQQRLISRSGHVRATSRVEGFEVDALAHCVLANELLDVLPVHLVQVLNGNLKELFVVLNGARLSLEPGQPSTPALEAYFQGLGLQPAEGCWAEVNLASVEWMKAAAAVIRRGLLLVLDYGYPADVLYDESRRRGTLLCYFGHTLNSDPLARIGRQDITSHIDFTSLRQAGESAGLKTLGLVSQRRLLTNLGWQELRRRIENEPVGQAERGANLRAMDQLVEPNGLGRILALVQHRGLDALAPIGLTGPGARAWRHVPMLTPEHLRLPDPAEAEGLPDFEAQWAELWSGAENEVVKAEPRPSDPGRSWPGE